MGEGRLIPLVSFGPGGLVRCNPGAVTSHVSPEAPDPAERYQAQRLQCLGLLAGGLVHDLNNLLAVIRTHAELGMEGSEGTPDSWEAFAEIMTAVERAGSLTRSILRHDRFSTLEREGRTPPPPDPSGTIELSQLLQLLHPLLGRLVRSNVQVELTTPTQPLLVQADEVALQQILFNLCVNSSQAMPRGGTVRLEARYLTCPSGFAQAELKVIDTGHGIPQAALPHIFEPFYSTKKTQHGSGLGLSVVRQLVSDLAGTIEVSSHPGLGTVVRLCLPIAELRDQTAATSSPSRIGLRTRGTETILLAEQDPALSVALSKALRASGYTVVTACDGFEAVELVKGFQRSLDVLILNRVLPGCNGDELLRQLNAASIQLPSLLLETERALPLPSWPWPHVCLIDKPSSARDLMYEVRQLLEPQTRTPSSRPA